MADVWLELPATLLRPSRPALARCLAEREIHLAARRRIGEERARVMSDCERRIEQLRAAVFAASDGRVGAKMTDLEREWRGLAKVDPDAGMMDLWARIAPTDWHDRKVWRDGPAIDRVDLAVALASDVEGVKAAEDATRKMRAIYEAEAGITIGARISWRFFDHDRAVFVTTNREPPPPVREDVRDAVLARFPDRPLFARDVAYLATQKHRFVEAVRALWRTGYNIHSFDADGFTLEMPAL
jgi:hypothetical protein